MKVIRIIELAGYHGPDAGLRWSWSDAAAVEGLYVKAYDPDANDGRGDVELTADPTDALRFATASDALAFYQQQSTVRPLRSDGRPNRPLTAYTVEVCSP